MLDTAPAIRFYLSIDNLAGNHPLLANYLLYLDSDDRRRESWRVMGKAIKMTNDVHELIREDYDADECRAYNNSSEVAYIENALNDIYQDLWSTAIYSARAENKIPPNKVVEREELNTMHDYERRILNTFYDYGPKVDALHEVLTPNRFWYLDKPIIVPPDCFEPKYTWGFK